MTSSDQRFRLSVVVRRRSSSDFPQSILLSGLRFVLRANAGAVSPNSLFLVFLLFSDTSSRGLGTCLFTFSQGGDWPLAARQRLGLTEGG